MRFIPTDLGGVVIVEPDVFQDSRGVFFETYHAGKYAEHGIVGPFVQDNFSRSVRGSLRGLHYQLKQGQGKLVSVLDGCIYDVAVDIRRGSPTFGKWIGTELSSDNKRQMFIPVGFAHGFCALSETASVLYKCTAFYARDDEGGIVWNDPKIGIKWPIDRPLLSGKDQAYQSLGEHSPDALPVYAP